MLLLYFNYNLLSIFIVVCLGHLLIPQPNPSHTLSFSHWVFIDTEEFWLLINQIGYDFTTVSIETKGNKQGCGFFVLRYYPIIHLDNHAKTWSCWDNWSWLRDLARYLSSTRQVSLKLGQPAQYTLLKVAYCGKQYAFEIKLVNGKIIVFWFLTSCNTVIWYWHYEGTCCLAGSKLMPRWLGCICTNSFSPKDWCSTFFKTAGIDYSVTSQKTAT